MLNVVIAWQRNFFLAPFTSDAHVLAYAGERIVAVLMFQFAACYYEMTGSMLRALDYSMTPALITIFGTCVVRLLWVFFFPSDGTFGELLSIYPHIVGAYRHNDVYCLQMGKTTYCYTKVSAKLGVCINY